MLAEESRKYTAFTFNGIQYSYKVLPFGLKVSGQTFVKCLENCLSESVKKNVAIYVDDIVVGSINLDQHLKHLNELFLDIRRAGIKLNLGKKHLCKHELEFVGHLISMEGIKPVESKIRKIQDIESPRTVKQLRSFIGFV